MMGVLPPFAIMSRIKRLTTLTTLAPPSPQGKFSRHFSAKTDQCGEARQLDCWSMSSNAKKNIQPEKPFYFPPNLPN